MKDSDITDEMVDRFQDAACFELECCSYQESIAAAVNAVFGDPTPITAGRLRSLGYINQNGGTFWYSPTDGLDPKEPRIVVKCWSYDKAVAPDDYPVIDKVEIHFDQAMSETGRYVETLVQTLGELRALHIGLGQPLVEVQP